MSDTITSEKQSSKPKDESSLYAVWSWGSNAWGKLGHGNGANSFVPCSIPLFSGQIIRQVACSEHHSAALTNDGDVYVWGLNTVPEFKQEAYQFVYKGTNTPKICMAFRNKSIIKICAGAEYLLALSDQGLVYIFRSNQSSAIDEEANGFAVPVEELVKEKIIDISSGDFHCAALNSQGEVWLWTEPQMQVPSNAKFGATNQVAPYCKCLGTFISTQGIERFGETRVRKIDLLEFESLLFNKSKVIKVVCGGKFTAILTDEGKLYTWGHNNHGQLGIGSIEDKIILSPTLVKSIEDKVIISISLGYQHAAIITSDDCVYTWGYGVFGQLGNGDKIDVSIPTKIDSLSNIGITQISCGYAHTSCITAMGDVFCFGWNNFGQAGFSSTEKEVKIPKLVEALCGENLKGNCVHQISCGSNHTVVLSGPKSTLATELKEQMNKKDLADCLFIIENREFYGHKVIFACRSNYFFHLFENNKSNGEEERILKYEIPSEITFTIFESIVEYLYTGRIKLEDKENEKKLLIACKLFELYELEKRIFSGSKLTSNNNNTSVITSEELSRDLSKFVNRNNFHDIVVHCSDGMKLFAHKNILSIRSSYFRTMFGGGMKESKGSILPIEVDSKVFKEILMFIYTGKGDINSENCSDLLALSNEYNLDLLKLNCELFIEQGIDEDNVVSIYEAALLYRANRLTRVCKNYMSKSGKTTLKSKDKSKEKKESKNEKRVEECILM